MTKNWTDVVVRGGHLVLKHRDAWESLEIGSCYNLYDDIFPVAKNEEGQEEGFNFIRGLSNEAMKHFEDWHYEPTSVDKIKNDNIGFNDALAKKICTIANREAKKVVVGFVQFISKSWSEMRKMAGDEIAFRFLTFEEAKKIKPDLQI